MAYTHVFTCQPFTLFCGVCSSVLRTTSGHVYFSIQSRSDSSFEIVSLVHLNNPLRKFVMKFRKCVSFRLHTGVCVYVLKSFFSLRMLFHKSSTPQFLGGVQRLQCADPADLQSAKSLVRKVISDSLMKLQGETSKKRRSIRWELGACWVQHLQNQASGQTDSKKTQDAKVEPAVKGLGKQGGLLKEIKKKADGKNSKTDMEKEIPTCNGTETSKKQTSDSVNEKDKEKQDLEKEMMLRKKLSEAAFLRLKESETGLHLKVQFAHFP